MSKNSFRYLRKGDGTSRFGNIKYPKFTKNGRYQRNEGTVMAAVTNLNFKNEPSSSTIDSGRFTGGSDYPPIVSVRDDILDTVKHRGIFESCESPGDHSFLFQQAEKADNLETRRFELVEKMTENFSLDSESSFYQRLIRDDIYLSSDPANILKDLTNFNCASSEDYDKLRFNRVQQPENHQSSTTAARSDENVQYDAPDVFNRVQQPENHQSPTTAAGTDENVRYDARDVFDRFQQKALSTNENHVHFDPVRPNAQKFGPSSVETAGSRSDPFSILSERLLDRLPPFTVPPVPQFFLPPSQPAYRQQYKVSKEPEKNLPTKKLADLEQKLESTILNLTKDTEKLELIRIQLEETEKQLDLEKEKLKNEKREFDSFVAEEMRKIDKERNLLSKEKTGLKNKQQEQISLLRKQIVDMQNDMCEREAHFSGSRAKTRQLESELNVLKKDYESLRCRFQNIEDKSAKLEKENAQLRCKNWSLKENLSIDFAGSGKTVATGSSTTKLPPMSSSDTAVTKTSCLSNGGNSSTSLKMGNSSSSKSVRFFLPDESPVFRRTEDRCIQTTENNDYSENETCTSTQTSIIVDTPRHVTTPKFRTACSSSSMNIINQTLERRRSDGSKEIIHHDGTVEEVDSQGRTVLVTYPNGDTRKFEAGGLEVYHFSSSDITQIRSPTGLVILHYKDGRKETHFEDGSKEIVTSDRIKRRISVNGMEKIEYPNGETSEQKADGSTVFNFKDGSVETRTSEYTKREFPNGDVKILYHKDGTIETRLVSGRIRIKDSDGNIIRDEQQ